MATNRLSFAQTDLAVRAGDDGITVSNDDESAWLYVGSGHISILFCYEGIESNDIVIINENGRDADGNGDIYNQRRQQTRRRPIYAMETRQVLGTRRRVRRSVCCFA